MGLLWVLVCWTCFPIFTSSYVLHVGCSRLASGIGVLIAVTAANCNLRIITILSDDLDDDDDENCNHHHHQQHSPEMDSRSDSDFL